MSEGFCGEWMRIPTKGTKPSPRCGHSLNLLGIENDHHLLVTAGESSFLPTREFYKDMYLLDLQKLEWKKVSQKQTHYKFTSRADHSATVFGECNENAFYFGGRVDGTYLSDTFFGLKLLSSSPKITPVFLQNSPSARRGQSVTAMKSEPKFVLFGGQFGSHFLNDLWRFDAHACCWGEIKSRNHESSMIPKRAYHSAFFDDNQSLIVFGGVYDSSARSVDPDIYRMDLRVERWSKIGSKDTLRNFDIALSCGHHNSHFLSTLDVVIYDHQKPGCYVLGGNSSTSNIGKCSLVNLFGPLNQIPPSFVRTESVLVEEKHSAFDRSGGVVDFPSLFSMYTFGGFSKKYRKSTSDVYCLKFCQAAFKSQHKIGKHHQQFQTSDFRQPQNLTPLRRPHRKHRLELKEEKSFVTPKKHITRRVKHSQTPVKMSSSKPSSKVVYEIPSAAGRKCLTGMNMEMVAEIKGFDGSIASLVIKNILTNGIGGNSVNEKTFFLTGKQTVQLCHLAAKMFSEEPTMLEVGTPTKVFGDIHGQLDDLMNIFKAFGSPDHVVGDIQVYNYLFLGDYVDRGNKSLEVMCLLLALKIRYPKRMFLIRGNHEERTMNSTYGFHAECRERIADQTDEVIQAMSTMFHMLPLAALIENKILCVHGGIGRLENLEQIRRIRRPAIVTPVNPTEETQIIQDILWSDPSENDKSLGIKENGRGVSVTFGPDIVKKFCRHNSIELIIRAHQVVPEGYEYFASGQLMTLFSATNYGGVYSNNGAILVINDELVVQPKTVIAAKVKQKNKWRKGPPPSPMRSGKTSEER